MSSITPDPLHVGDTVRVTSLGAMGTILHISARLRHAPYLVDCGAYGERSYAAADLARVVQAVRAGQVLKCGACGSLNMGPSACRQCGTLWRH